MYKIKYMNSKGDVFTFQTVAQSNREAIAKCQQVRDVYRIIAATRKP